MQAIHTVLLLLGCCSWPLGATVKPQRLKPKQTACGQRKQLYMPSSKPQPLPTD